MSQHAWAERWVARSQVGRIVPLLCLLLAPLAHAERLTINPETQLSLDFKVLGTPPCILLPEKAYEPEACAEIPQEKKSVPPNRGGMRALVFLKQPGHVFLLMVASIQRPGIGQLSDRDIQGFIQGTLTNVSKELGAPMHAVEGAGKPYTIQRVNGVPVARWEYTAELQDSDPRANTASAVVYLIPSRDTLDILSINTHRQELEAARTAGEQVISTLQVPLTIDAEEFGGNATVAVGLAVGRVLVPLALVLVAVGWIGWRLLKARDR